VHLFPPTSKKAYPPLLVSLDVMSCLRTPISASRPCGYFRSECCNRENSLSTTCVKPLFHLSVNAKLELKWLQVLFHNIGVGRGDERTIPPKDF